MPRRFPPEYEKPQARKSGRLLKAEGRESIEGHSLTPVESLPSQVGNLAMQRMFGHSLSDHSFELGDVALDQQTAGLGGGSGGNKDKPPSQPQKRAGKRSANPGGRGPGRLRNARETFYEVSGPTLDSITGQLHPAAGFPAETNAPIGITGRVRPQRLADGSFRAEVQWRIAGATTTLPRWADYDNACPAAQTEWDRFMGQTRVHEQSAHVDAALAFVSNLGPADTVMTGASVDEVQQNLEAKQAELAARLQAIHDACTHGMDIDAILHPENGVCDRADSDSP